MAGRMQMQGMEELIRQFQDLNKRLEHANLAKFCDLMAKEIAARIWGQVRKRTPVYRSIPGDINDHTGGNLRRQWTIGPVTREGRYYVVKVTNNADYASYVEFGHRGVYVPAVGKVLHLDTRYTEPQYMLTKSEKEVKLWADKHVEQRLLKYLEDVFRDQ